MQSSQNLELFQQILCASQAIPLAASREGIENTPRGEVNTSLEMATDKENVDEIYPNETEIKEIPDCGLSFWGYLTGWEGE